MANIGNYDIPLFEDDVESIKEFFKIAVNTIIYHRWLGDNNFEDTESSFPNITYIKLKNTKLQETVDKYTNALENALLGNNKVKVTIKFYQGYSSGFFNQSLVGLWEVWNFLFDVKINDENSVENEKENKIRKYIFCILERLNDKYDFMPDFPPNSTLPTETFPFEIKISNITDDDYIALLKSMSVKSALKDDNF